MDGLCFLFIPSVLGGDLITFFNREGVRATEELLKEQMPLLLYNKGEGQVVTRVDYLKWKYRGKGHVRLCFLSHISPEHLPITTCFVRS